MENQPKSLNRNKNKTNSTLETIGLNWMKVGAVSIILGEIIDLVNDTDYNSIPFSGIVVSVTGIALKSIDSVVNSPNKNKL